MADLVKALVILAGLAGCNSCQPAAAPTDQAIYGELVEGGCLAPSDGGLASVADEHALTSQPTWLACLYDGGTVAACGVPCSPAEAARSSVRKPERSVCAQACSDLIALGCVQRPACATTIDPAKCAALVGVKSVADVKAKGWSCGP